MYQLKTQKEPKYLTASIIDYMFDFDGKKKFAKFVIEVRYGESHVWQVRRRQKLFEKLESLLKQHYKGVPDLPKTSTGFALSLFEDHYSKENMQKRMELYEAWLRKIIIVQEYYSFPLTCAFFEVYGNADVSIRQPTFQGMVESTSDNFLNFYVDTSNDWAVAIGVPAMSTNKITKFISNIITGNDYEEKGQSHLIQYETSHKTITRVIYFQRYDIEQPETQDQSSELKNMIKEDKQIKEGENKEELLPSANLEPSQVNETKGFKESIQDAAFVENTVVKEEPGPTDGKPKPEKELPVEKKKEKKEEIREKEKVDAAKLWVPLQQTKASVLKLKDYMNPHCYFNFRPMHSIGFLFEATTVAYSNSGKAVAIGFSNGSIAAFNHNDRNFSNIQTYKSAHTDRVLKLAFDVNRKCLLSLGADNKLIVIDLVRYKTKTSCSIPGSQAITFLYDELNHLCFVSKAGDSVYVIEFFEQSLYIRNKFSTKLKPPMKAFTAYFEKGLQGLFGGSHIEGNIRLYQSSNFIDERQPTICMMELEGQPGLRLLKYWRERAELYCAYDNGSLKVYLDIPVISKLKPKMVSPGNPKPMLAVGCKI